MMTKIYTTSPAILFFFNDTATTEIYTLSLHDALPICARGLDKSPSMGGSSPQTFHIRRTFKRHFTHVSHRSEEHTSELQSHVNLVCRLLLEKKKIHIAARMT